jgi:8-oxo-dGTP pyrophosphatase MutT (NUDIX family)
MAKITIVDSDDKVIGSEDRDIVRSQGLRHRIARVFIMRGDGYILLHKRNSRLTDNPGKWDQSVGGHVDADEDYLAAARRETLEELGIAGIELQAVGKFYIERPAPGGYVRRFQTVFTGYWEGPIHYDKAEIEEVKWFSVEEITSWLATSPDDFTKNFAAAFQILKASL